LALVIKARKDGCLKGNFIPAKENIMQNRAANTIQFKVGAVRPSVGRERKILKTRIAQLEDRLDDIGTPGNDLYKRAIANMYRGMLCVYKDQLDQFSRSRCA
jgi:hypothetical protein